MYPHTDRSASSHHEKSDSTTSRQGRTLPWQYQNVPLPDLVRIGSRGGILCVQTLCEHIQFRHWCSLRTCAFTWVLNAFIDKLCTYIRQDSKLHIVRIGGKEKKKLKIDWAGSTITYFDKLQATNHDFPMLRTSLIQRLAPLLSKHAKRATTLASFPLSRQPLASSARPFMSTNVNALVSSQVVEPRVLSKEPLQDADAKWIGLHRISYVDPHNTQRVRHCYFLVLITLRRCERIQEWFCLNATPAG